MQRDDRDDPGPPSGDDGQARRVGWLAVAATCVVLTAIMFAAATLTGSEGDTDRIDSFPGPPTGGLLTAEPPGPRPSRAVAEPTVEHVEPTEPSLDTLDVTSEPRPGREQGSEGAEPDRGGAEPGPGRPPARTDGPPAPTRTAAPPEPTMSTGPSVEPTPGVAADAMIDATLAFYSLLPHDVDGAWKLVGGSVRARGYAAFAAMWADVKSVSVTDLRVVTSSNSVQVVTHVVRTDGSTSVEHHNLVFRDTGKLVIEQLSRPKPNGNEPAR